MPRPLSIYPSTGYTFGLPNVPDPNATAPLVVTYQTLNFKADKFIEHTETFGIAWDDSFHGTNALVNEIVNVLSNLWTNLHTMYRTFKAVDFGQQHPFFLQSQSNLIPADSVALVQLSVFQIPDKVDYWWNTGSFAKFGYFSPGSGIYNYPQQWINFAFESFEVEQASVNQFIVNFVSDGFLANGFWYPRAEPPPITAFDAFGNNYVYDDNGLSVV